MSYRDQREQFEHLVKLLEEENERLKAGADELLSERRAERGRRFRRGVSKFFERLIYVFLLCSCIFLVLVVVHKYEEASETDRQRRATEHREMLRTQRANPPEGVDPAAWVWCVDFCARYHNAEHHYTSEGVVVGSLIDRRLTPPGQIILVWGPWLDESGTTDMNYEINEGNNLSINHIYRPGDLVRIERTPTQQGLSIAFRYVTPDIGVVR